MIETIWLLRALDTTGRITPTDVERVRVFRTRADANVVAKDFTCENRLYVPERALLTEFPDGELIINNTRIYKDGHPEGLTAKLDH